MSLVFLTEQQMHRLVSGKNKAFMTRTIKQQLKYGNVDMFDAVIDTKNKSIRIGLGEGQGTFIKSRASGRWEHDFGYLTHIKECAEIANEIMNSITA